MRFIQYWRHMRTFQSLLMEKRAVVFYSEGPAYWVYFEPIIRHLTLEHKHTICYVSSSPDDPGLHQENERILCFCIGEGIARTTFFRTLQAGLIVMTMPELEKYHIKRSIHPVHYVYINHSIVSTHMVYRPGAFDHFDSFFCVGPHHIEEIRKTEKLYGLPEKELFKHGYGRLDTIIKEAKGRPKPLVDRGKRRILVAPSWGPTGLLETKGEELTKVLLTAGYHVTVRPHPHMIKRNPIIIDRLLKLFKGHSDFAYDGNVASQDSHYQAHLMISDWSGAALDYAFGLDRPVLFIDVPPKINNPNYQKLDIVPLEMLIREKIGSILPPEQINEAPLLIERLMANSSVFAHRIRALRDRWIYNVGESGARGAERIIELATTRKTT